MKRNSSDVSGTLPTEGSHPLTDRVLARVTEVSLALEKKARGASRRRSKNHSQDARSLRRVFNELAVTHRHHRQQSGQRASAELREAARAFKEGPTLPGLVLVASFLEEDGLLAW